VNKFYKNLFRRNALYISGILALAGLVLFIYMDIQASVLTITQKNNTLATRSNSLSSLAILRGEFEKAKPYFSLLENILPPRDQLLSFSKELEGIAKKNSLEFGFTFGEERLATPTEPGYIAFRATVTGTYAGLANFLRSLETGRYFIDVSTVDSVKKGDGFSNIINGRVFFR